MAVVTAEVLALLKEIKADQIAERLLQGKCQWEQMSMAAVLREWGDPRTWSAYKDEVAALSA